MTIAKLSTRLLMAIIVYVMNVSFCFAQIAQTSTYPLVPSHALNRIPNCVEFYQYDPAPLGGREPLVLIHGLLGQYHPFFRWQRLAQYLNQNKQFCNRYKIYLARYDTQSSRQELTQLFIEAFHKFNRGHNITVVTISLPGAIMRDAMKDTAVGDSIRKVLTLGAFFHGSPLFCSDWMKETIRKTHFSPLTREERLLAYDLYFSRHKKLLTDYKWEENNEHLPGIDSKFIVYAGFITSDHFPTAYSALHQLVVSPWTFFHTTLPAHLGVEHPALRLLNTLISNSTEPKAQRHSLAYALNDGISPTSSGLLFAHPLISNPNFSANDYFAYLKANSDARKSRIFANVDHLTFIEGQRINKPSKDVTDILSNSEEPKPMFAWILNDLVTE